MSDDSTLSPWATARTILELGDVTARWLLGEVAEHPNGYGRPDEETDGLVPALVEINRLGFLTDFSQPGERTEFSQQRASVSGYCSEATVNAILGGLGATELIVLALPFGDAASVQIPVTLQADGAEATWVGAVGQGFIRAVDEYPSARADFLRAWEVEVIDPVWGRNDRLWPALVATLRERPVRRMVDHGVYDKPPPGCELV